MDRVSEHKRITSAIESNDSNYERMHHVINNRVNSSLIPDYCQVIRFEDNKGNIKEMLFPKNLDLERPKRARTNFTTKQLETLESTFSKNQYLVGKERKALSQQLHLSELQIKIWYQNRRTKSKREQYKEKERLEANAESIAATNIMRLLQVHNVCSVPSDSVSNITNLNNDNNSNNNSINYSNIFCSYK